jgi:hypothetical protein
MIGRSPPAIRLRDWSDQDLPLLRQTMGDPAMTEHLGGPESAEQLAGRHERYLALAGSGKGHMLVIEIPTASAPVGSVGYWERAGPDELVWEIGWAVIPAYQGQSIATRATRRSHQAGAGGEEASVRACLSIGRQPTVERDLPQAGLHAAWGFRLRVPGRQPAAM